jgi:hypothetical protein
LPGRAAVPKEAANWSRVYDFAEFRIRPTQYTIEIPEGATPVSWVLEGSEDGSNWSEFDLQNEAKLGTFKLKISGESRFLRLSVSGTSAVTFGVFGPLLDSPKPATQSDLEGLRAALRADQAWLKPITSSIEELRTTFETNRQASLNQIQGLLDKVNESSGNSNAQVMELSQKLQGLSDSHAGVSNGIGSRVTALDTRLKQLSDGLNGQMTAFCEQRAKQRDQWWARQPSRPRNLRPKRH